MPFDKISLRQLFIMRIFTGLMFMAMGSALALMAGSCTLDPTQCTTRFASPADNSFMFAALTFGVLLTNAGIMLLELVTKPPMKLSINVPFVAANFQMALCFGVIAAGVAANHATLSGPVSSNVGTIQALCLAGFAMNLFFVVMTKLHWNFTENTGKALPTA
jgi:hypothetical protein